MTYDGIILGSGHNSLVLQAYLGRAGLKVLCLEQRHVAGGGLSTEEQPRRSGFLHNTHSFYHRGLNRMQWYRDLELEKHGAVYLEPELNVALILRSGDTLEWWTDFEKTAASFGRFSSKDEASLRRWRNDFLPIVERILVPESQLPPLPPQQRIDTLGKSAEGRLLLEVSALSPLEFILREFEHPVAQAGLLFFNGLREVDMRCRGFGHHIPALLASPGKAQMCIGGSAALARALVSAVTESGGEIQLQTTPRRILVKNGRASGVETSDGVIYEARHFVASGLNPQQTFLELIEEDLLPQEWRDKAREFKYNLIAPLFGLYLNLKDPPRYAAKVGKAFMVILGLEHFEGRSWRGLFTAGLPGGTPAYVVAVIEHATRRIRIPGVTLHPSREWATQQARHLITDPGEQAHRVRFMIRGRGPNLTAAVDMVLAEAGIGTVLGNVATPRINAIAERWIGGCRRELLDRTLVWNQAPSAAVLRDYETHHNQHRPHRSLHAAAETATRTGRS